MQDEAAREEHARQSRRWKQWDEFVESTTSAGFRQSSWYADWKGFYNGWKHFRAVLRDGGAIVGGAVVFRISLTDNTCYYFVPDGPVLVEDDSPADQEQVFQAIISSIEASRQNERKVVSHLYLSPMWTQLPSFVTGFKESSASEGSPRNTQSVDLTLSEGAILAQMKEKGRYNVGLARRHGVSVVEDLSRQGIEDFLDIYREMNERKGRRGRDPDYFHTLVSLLSPSHRGSIFFAEYQGARLATALVVYCGRTATYYYGASRAIHRNVMAPYLLHFEIMRRAKSRGCECYDLMGIAPLGERDDRWADISVFKRKFGGREVRRVPDLEYIYDPVAYEDWNHIQRDRAERAAAGPRRKSAVE